MKKSKKIMSAVLIVIMFMRMVPTFASGEDWRRTSYDGREAGFVTPVQDQGSTNLCWAYAAIGAAEASLLKSKIIEDERLNVLSPVQLGYACHNRGSDPLNNTNGVQNQGDYRQSKGTTYYAASLFSQWCGPVGKNMSDGCDGWKNAKYCLTESVHINAENLKVSEEERLKIKKAIVKYGAVTFSYNNASERYYYNPSNETGAAAYSHACVIVGWDDDIPAANFLPGGATQNGGWLVKNSYSSLPFFYLSYDNSSSNTYAFSFAKRGAYENNYFYDSDTEDFGLASLIKPRCAANVLEAKNDDKNEGVAAINVGVDGNNAKITVKVYTDLKDTTDPTSGNLAATGQIEVEYPGYYTIELSNTAMIDKGSYFSAVAEISGSDAYFKLTQNEGKSFINRGSGWGKATGTPRIKAYTKIIDKKIEISDGNVILNTNEPGTLILTYYDGASLKDIRIFSTKDSADGQFDIPKEWAKKSGHRVKAMLWNSFESMRPICAQTAEIAFSY